MRVALVFVLLLAIASADNRALVEEMLRDVDVEASLLAPGAHADVIEDSYSCLVSLGDECWNRDANGELVMHKIRPASPSPPRKVDRTHGLVLEDCEIVGYPQSCHCKRVCCGEWRTQRCAIDEASDLTLYCDGCQIWQAHNVRVIGENNVIYKLV